MSTRDRLVGTMSTFLRERGYGSSAIKEVLEQAEATAGSMYHFFPDGKDELAAAAVKEIGLGGNELLATVLGEADTVADGVVVFYEALVGEMEASGFRLGCPIGVPSTEAAVTVDGIRVAGEEVFTAWINTIAAALEEEGWKPDAATTAARFAISAYEGASTVARTCRDTSVLRDTLCVVRDVLSRPPDLSPL